MNDSTNQDLLRLKQMLEEATAADTSVVGQPTRPVAPLRI